MQSHREPSHSVLILKEMKRMKISEIQHLLFKTDYVPAPRGM